MQNKKNIDRLFQEKFKDFEVSPNAKMWSNIKDELDKKNKPKRIIPLWFKYGSIAAVLLLFLAIGFMVKDTFNTTKPLEKNATIIVNTEKENKVENNNLNNQNTQDNSKQTKSLNTPIINSKNAQVVTSNNASYKTNSENGNTSNSTSTNSNNNNRLISNTNTSSSKLNNYKNSSVINKSNTNTINSKENTTNFVLKKQKVNTAIAKQNSNYNNSISTKNNEAYNASENKNLEITNKIDTQKQNDILKETNLTNALTEEKTKEAIKDSTIIDLTIEDAIAKNEDVIEKEKLTNKWFVNANIAPVYYNSLGKGSHIDDQFINNPKNGEVNTSYGVKVGYALSKKITIRSGINSLNLSYDTANVLVYDNVATPNNAAASSGSVFKNITFKNTNPGTTESFAILSGDEFSVLQTSSLVGNNLNAGLSQRISYIEIPLEIEYKIIDKRFGLNVITGFSSFFAGENEVVSEIAGRKRVIGEANNINDVSFSTNFGIGIDYKFSDSFKFNLEPTFKYQINAYSETSGNFNPYIIGVYTGFNYRF